jgi:hypothetical protein
MTIALTRKPAGSGRGEVYQKLYVAGIDDTTWTNNTIGDVTNASITDVPAGTYLVTFGCTFRIQTTGMTTAGGVGSLYITDSANSYLSSSATYTADVSISRYGADGGTDQFVNQFNKSVEITLSATTTVKLRAIINDIGAAANAFGCLGAYMIWERIE